MPPATTRLRSPLSAGRRPPEASATPKGPLVLPASDSPPMAHARRIPCAGHNPSGVTLPRTARAANAHTNDGGRKEDVPQADSRWRACLRGSAGRRPGDIGSRSDGRPRSPQHHPARRADRSRLAVSRAPAARQPGGRGRLLRAGQARLRGAVHRRRAGRVAPGRLRRRDAVSRRPAVVVRCGAGGRAPRHRGDPVPQRGAHPMDAVADAGQRDRVHAHRGADAPLARPPATGSNGRWTSPCSCSPSRVARRSRRPSGRSPGGVRATSARAS